ncbi:homoserine kinase [Candidatus Woesearchaeota archaeon]|nr:homoserine kinase [Candidatus Woesearchaeota archaeon]
MVVKTRFTKKEIENILSNYDLGRLISYRGLSLGCIQSTYLIKTTKGRYALRYYDIRNLKQISVEIEFLLKLEKTDIPYTRIVKTRNKKPLLQYKKRPVLITKFLEGSFRNKNKKTYAKQLGLILGKMHKVSMNFKPKHYKSKWTLDYDFVRRFYNRRKRAIPKLIKKHDKVLNEAVKHLKVIDGIKLPMGMNHGDLLHDDILFVGDKVSGILDFDDCSYGYLLSDLATVIGFWCIDNKVHFDYIKEAVRNYNRKRKLSKLEKNNLYYFVILMLTVFVLDETEDAKYPRMEYFKLLYNFIKIKKEDFDKRLR